MNLKSNGRTYILGAEYAVRLRASENFDLIIARFRIRGCAFNKKYLSTNRLRGAIG